MAGLPSAVARPLFVATLFVAAIPGCGGGDGSGPGEGAAETGSLAPPLVSIEPARTAETDSVDRPNSASADAPAAEGVATGGGPEKGSAEWYLQEIAVLRTRQLPEGSGADSAGKAIERRNQQIVDLAMQVIVKTHDAPDREAVFNEGVRRLLEARLQLALTGKEEYGHELYRDCEQFQKRAPESTSAAIAGHVRLRYAQANALRYGRQDHEWIEEYARQARLFASDFPGEVGICGAALSGAARSCELNGLAREASLCYAMLVQRFPKSPQASLAAGVLRRMDLVGRPLVLKGPTLDGGFTSIEDHRGRVVLVVFWTSAAKPFRDQLPALAELESKYGRFGLAVLGVCLDGDEAEAESFLAESKVAWPQLYHSDPGQRGWQHPAAEYYGIRDVPTLIVVDHTGTTRHVARDAAALEEPIRAELLRLRAALKEKERG